MVTGLLILSRPKFLPSEKEEWWLKSGVDFVKEVGKRKFWHFCVYGIFHTPYDKSWVETTELAINMLIPDELKPSRPSTFWTYIPTVKTEYERRHPNLMKHLMKHLGIK